MDTIPSSHREIFERLYALGRLDTLSEEDRLEYDYCLKKARDYNAEMRYVREEGYAEGYAEGMKIGLAEWKYKVASKLLESGVELKKISEITDIPLTELQEHFN